MKPTTMKLHWVREGEIGEYYFDALTPYLQYEIIPYSKDTTHPLRIPCDYKYGIPVYFFEDSRKSYLARALLGAHPGITILTSYFLTDYGPEPLHNSPWQETCANLKSSAGDFNFHPREYEWKQTPERAKRESFVSLASVFTSQEARAEYQKDRSGELLPFTGVDAFIPFPLKDEHLLLVNNKPKKVAWCGSVNLEWRPHKILSALKGREAVWLIDQSERQRAIELCSEFNQHQVEIRIGRSPEAWRALLEEGVLPCHLLFSGFHSLSPYLELSIASGLPTIASSYGFPETFPEGVIYKVDSGENESLILSAYYDRLLNRVEDLNLKKFKQEVAQEFFAAKMVAQEFSRVIKQSESTLPHFIKQWEKLYQAADQRVLIEGLSESYLAESFRELGWV